MKKILALLIVSLMFASQAYAITYTVSSREKIKTEGGTEKLRVRGTIAFDSSYPYNTTTGRGGEALSGPMIGLSTIDRVSIDPEVATTANGLMLFKYHAAMATETSGSGSGIRAYYAVHNATGNIASLTSAPTYDLSGLTAVPFDAIGSL